MEPLRLRRDLFPWVEVTVGAGDSGAPPPANLSDTTTREGAASMGFYNIAKGDVPYFKSLADTYAISDNFHQSIQGGTGANHIALGTGDADWYSDGNGNAIAPPTLLHREPDPQPGTNNWYTQDGYSGGTYSDCADETQPGRDGGTAYLKQLDVKPNCEKGHYYILNNYNPGYFGDGTLDTVDDDEARQRGVDDHEVRARRRGPAARVRRADQLDEGVTEPLIPRGLPIGGTREPGPRGRSWASA